MAKKMTIYSVLIFATFTGTSAAVANVLATTVQSKTWDVIPSQAAYSVLNPKPQNQKLIHKN
jgi:hypothetical protein